MADAFDIKIVHRFNGQNFQHWKFQMRTAFVADDLLDIVEAKLKKPDTDEGGKQKHWIKRDAKAIGLISSSVDYAQLGYLLSCSSSNEM